MHSGSGRGVSRRDALRYALAGFGIAALGPTVRASALARPSGAPRVGQKFLVIVELDGGNDWLNTVVPQGLANYTTKRPAIALDGGATLALDSGTYATTEFRLHGSMAGLAQAYRDGELAIVRKVGYQQANKSHDTSRKIWAQGLRNAVNGNGWIARYAEQQAPTALGAVSIGVGRHRALAGGSVDPLSVGSLQSFRFDADTRYNNNHLHRLEGIRELLAARGATASRDAVLAGHALAGQIKDAVDNYSSTVTYRTGSLSNRLIDVARMVQAGFETRIYYTKLSGFDTHGAQLARHVTLLQALDEGITDLADDLRAMGVWNDAVILVMSEFGRRIFENGSGGTDHGEAGCMLLAGGAVRGGLHGPALIDADLDDDNLDYGIDFRSIYANVLAAHLGVADPTQVFPEALEIAATPDLIL
ncbi:MAG: DUF1501 domain-containing protein [Planctomycetes bacterium]|nr:DUF1501 domain-containing protein [Planctomycetota bacterium]